MRTALTTRSLRRWLAATAFSVLAAIPPVRADEPVLVLPVGSIDTAEGRIAPAVIALQGGKILAIAAPDALGPMPADAKDMRKLLQAPQLAALARVSIMPLAIDANSQRGAEGPLTEVPIAPGLCAADAVDVFDAGWAHAARAGVGYAVFAPDEEAVLGGTAVLLRPGAPLLELPQRRAVALFGSIAPSAYRRDSEPQSRTNALAMIRSAFAAAARGDTAGPHYRDWRPDGTVLRAVLAKELPFALRVQSASDVDHALALFAELRVTGILVGGNGAVAERVAPVAAAGVSVVLDPLSAADTDRLLELPAALAAAKVPFAFASRAPLSIESGLYDQAALAVLHGLDPRAAWHALTAAPVAIYKLPASTALAVGASADFNVFVGDPASFTAPRVQVVKGGRIDIRALVFGN